MCAAKILTTGGFTKLPPIPQSTKDHKIVLYCLVNPNSEKIERAKTAILKELNKGWMYKGDLESFEESIKQKNYLLREGKQLELIDGSEIAGKHHIKISNTASYLFKSIVEIGRDLNISGSNANIVFNLPTSSQKPKPSSGEVYHLPNSPENFTGREEILKELDDMCRKKNRVLLSGLGGIGKTTTALEYANNHKKDYVFIHFINGMNSTLTEEGLIDLGGCPKSS